VSWLSRCWLWLVGCVILLMSVRFICLCSRLMYLWLSCRCSRFCCFCLLWFDCEWLGVFEL